MGYFAELDENDMVIRVIVADQRFINSGMAGNPRNFIETDKNGRIRKNYAARGHKYDRQMDAFIPPKPFDSWVLNPETARYEPPKAPPRDEYYYNWNERLGDWVRAEPRVSR